MCPLRSGRGGRLAHCLLLLLFGISIHKPFLVNAARESHLRIGKALNIFMRFGYLGISVHVIPYNDTTEEVRWLFREPTHNIYKNISELGENYEHKTPGIFHGDFHMEFCDNRRQLYQAYFRDFSIERLDRPWEAYSGGWFPDNVSRKMGINTSFIQGDYSYVLVRLVRFREIGKIKSDELPESLVLDNYVKERIRDVKVGNLSSVIKFFENVGTHYINSYTTGNSLYQVFVYNRKNYQLIKEHIKSKGINGLSKQDLYRFFAPWFAEHLGQIRSASANATVERWARRKLQYQYLLVKYVTLLKLHGNGTLLRTLDSLLGNEAVLQLDLKSLNVIFRHEPKKQLWFHEVLDNHMKLWESNMPLY